MGVDAYFIPMDMLNSKDAVYAAATGSVVADATGMGLHWIYSQGKIRQVVQKMGGVAEFLEPDEEHYAGVPSFFAHPLRHAGDSSSYGEYLYVLLHAVDESGFHRNKFIRFFQEYFGPGGRYVGYADTPMRETVYNITHLAKEIHQRVMDADSTLESSKKASAAHYISRYFFEFDTAGLKEQVRTPLKLQQWSAAELTEADRLVEVAGIERAGLGPDDDQMPALSRSVILAHMYSGSELDRVTEEAVRITNNNDKAVRYAVFASRMLRDLYEQDAQLSDPPTFLEEIVHRHLALLDDDSAALIKDALAIPELDIRGATKTFGAACHVDMAVPLVIHILRRTSTFSEANRANIMASGDNCGRAVLLGPLAGAMYRVGGERGIPQEWIERSTIMPVLRETPGGVLLFPN